MHGRMQRFAREAVHARASVHGLLEQAKPSVILFPPYSQLAPRHARALMPPVMWAHTAVFNVLELPVTSVPLGLSATEPKLPLGVQVVTGHGQDHVSIAVAAELERAFGGWTPPFPHE